MKNLITRAIFGAIYVAVIAGGILGGNLPFLLLMLLLVTLGINEFLTITVDMGGERRTPSVNSVLLHSLDCVGGGLMVITLWGGLFVPAAVTFLLYIVLRLSVQLWITRENPLISLAMSMMSQLYVALPVALMSVIYRHSPQMLLLMFVLVWINDTFAFLTGSMLGRHRLWERISPKKSWEGFIGGMVFTVIAAGITPMLFPGYFGMPTAVYALFGLVVSIAATAGDLIESLIKRTLGVKDSGHLIPGHGGILDRIDSILLVIPAAVIYLSFM